MVYISSDGTVTRNQPWSLQRLKNIIWAIFGAVLFFFQSLVGLDGNGRSGPRNGRGGDGRGGGNGPGGGPKRIGRITTIENCTMPGGG